MPSIAAMFSYFADHRGFQRLMAGVALLFTAQLLLSSACLMAADMPATPSDDGSIMLLTEVEKHCNADIGLHQQQPQAHACFHCEEPTQASSAVFALLSLDHISMFSVLDREDYHVFTLSMLISRTPTGPPRSSSLLFTTTQRILI